MNRLTITTGTSEDRHGHAIPESELETKLDRIRTYLAQEFGGFTEQQTVGGWANDEGRLVIELGRRYVIATADPFNTGRQAADYIRRQLGQASVMLERDRDADVSFVDAGHPGQDAAAVA